MDHSSETCTNICKALSDHTRFEILVLLKDNERCACKLLEHFRFSQPTLSYHMKILTESGLVTARKEGLWVHYSLNRKQFDSAMKTLSDTFAPNRSRSDYGCGKEE
ncbi:MAG: winged helix-turn-helix transcriptional regulator [Clostridiales bacterium]|nr:winged helix-turn-helix transcriptional regulator [Clostridiales bacterium]